MAINPKLERASLEAYAGIAIGIVLATVPMNWEWKVAAFLALAALAIDVALRSPWTYQWSRRGKFLACVISIIIVASIGYGPVVKQYDEDNRPRQAKFVLNISDMLICSLVSDANTAAFLLWVTIENEGAPSVAKNWSLSIKSRGQSSRNAVFIRLGDRGAPTCGAPANIGDALEDKTENKEVTGLVRGKLLFLVQGLSRADAADDNTALNLSVRNKDGTVFRFDALMRDLIGPRGPTNP